MRSEGELFVLRGRRREQGIGTVLQNFLSVFITIPSAA